MVDVSDSKSDGGNTVWVQVPSQAPLVFNSNIFKKSMLEFFNLSNNYDKIKLLFKYKIL